MSDIQRIFAEDPLKLSDQDIDAIINYMREKRVQFNLGAVKEREKKTKVPVDLDLNDIQI